MQQFDISKEPTHNFKDLIEVRQTVRENTCAAHVARPANGENRPGRRGSEPPAATRFSGDGQFARPSVSRVPAVPQARAVTAF